MGEQTRSFTTGETCSNGSQEDILKQLVQLHRAAQDLIRWQEKLWQLFLRETGITPTKYFAQRGTSQFGGSLGTSEWECFFHGIECEFYSALDGRIIQIEPLVADHCPGSIGFSSLSTFLSSLPPAEHPQYEALFKACFLPVEGTNNQKTLNAACFIRLLATAAEQSVFIPLFAIPCTWYRLGRRP